MNGSETPQVVKFNLLQNSLIEAAEFNNPTSDSQFGMQDVSKHCHFQEMFEIPIAKKNLIV